MLEQQTNNEHQIHIDVLPTDKFKTTLITFKFMAPLEYETITARSLLSKLLIRATKKWSTDKAFSKHLSELYGAYIHSFVSKFKDKHVITISLEIVNERYLKDSPPLFEKGLNVLYEVIMNPLIENNAFNTTFVNQEKSLLSKKIEAVIDNKAQYSFLNLLKYMFKDEPYRHLATGQIEKISTITPENLYNTYQNMISNDLCSIYVVGNVNKQEVKQLIQSKFTINPFTIAKTNQLNLKDSSSETQYIVEEDEVDQAKLNMGYRFPTRFGANDYYALVVLNTMFGGDPSSVLFNEVREKQSLAYSIHSQLDGKNGYLFVLSGVSADKYELAKDTILEEFDKFKRGEFDIDKLELAKKIIISHRHEITDRPKSIIEVMQNQLLLDYKQTDENYIDHIQKVTKDDVISMANKAELDTIYVLTKGDHS
ncbi:MULTISPECIES: EF-P 5-aminopentanol modification-associated protein YfmF [Staphylococcus]|uniref:EF-P 5-aminopentanol modification-associated protein YfmF n=2 Tax=Bacilli TaxID=91061 RepID=UPI0008A450C3|nr:MULTISPECIES: pitrilysin family protein [Staphylococcus]MCE0454774.1 insulinase family protein [Staphylococcus haemolyticus]MCH4353798.1 insulinase family protein [Staphylococcus haemolyticus]MCH4392441.1 insulinase family protein [Staphylococcus haemolyticus]MCH4476426.1 insulinase family protein [Staphylococcus haemolyticus]MCI2934347.1 insulinase family protein [Staphylococcus haemolyticus]